MGAVSRFLRLSAVALLTGGLLAVLSVAQTLSPGEISIRSWTYHPAAASIRVRTNEVQIGVVVRDAKDHVISDLTKNEFAIYDNRKQQSVSSFLVEKRQLARPAQASVVSAVTQLDLHPQSPPRPRYVALYFDDLSTEFGNLRHVQLAAENFIRTGVGPDDKVALFTASGLQTVDFTENTQGILDAIAKLKFHGRAIKSSGCPRITPYDAFVIATEPNPPSGPYNPSQPDFDSFRQGSPTYKTVLGEAVKCNCYDTGNTDPVCAEEQRQVIVAESQEIWNSVRQMSQGILSSFRTTLDHLADRPGERVLVLASSGFLTGTLEDQVDELIDESLRAGIVINALDAKGLYTYTETEAQAQMDGRDTSNQVASYRAESFGQSMMTLTAAMADFAVGTGGRFFHNRNDLAAGYYFLAAAPETEYLLGFVPQKEKLDGRFHKLKVEVNRPGKFSVQARPGYFAPTKASEEKASEPTPEPEQKIDAEVRSSESRSDFPLAVNEKSATATNAPELHVQIHVDIQKLPFQQENGRRVDMLSFIAALFDAGGKMVAGKEAQMQFALKPDSFKRLSESGINGDMSLEAPPGAYRLRVVVQEALRSRISAMTQTVRVQ